jgi:hypothetical protein
MNEHKLLVGGTAAGCKAERIGVGRREGGNGLLVVGGTFSKEKNGNSGFSLVSESRCLGGLENTSRFRRRRGSVVRWPMVLLEGGQIVLVVRSVPSMGWGRPLERKTCIAPHRARNRGLERVARMGEDRTEAGTKGGRGRGQAFQGSLSQSATHTLRESHEKEKLA